MRIECTYGELIDIEKVEVHPCNENSHPERQIEALAKIIAKVGMRSPIVISKLSGKVVKGHGRLAALKLLGWNKVPVDYQNYESELEELNDRVADNEIARYAEFQMDVFTDNLEALNVEMATLDLVEFGLLPAELDCGNWDSDIEPKGESNLDGIGVRVIITCKKEDYEHIKELIESLRIEETFDGSSIK
jgi:hypothetical protein